MAKKILITAGPTREYIDPVRYISNDSSGLMGLALADASHKLGAKTTLITGPTNLYHSRGGKVVGVVSAREMFKAVRGCYRSADIIVCAAAVADFRPVRYSRLKIKKNVAAKFTLPGKASFAATQGGREGEGVTLQLIPNPDILAWLGRHKLPHQRLIGFALETNNLVKNAKKKLKEKGCDMIVANSAKTIGKKRSSAIVIGKDGFMFHVSGSKKAVAKAVLKRIFQNS